LQATPRSATVRAADGPAKVWALDRSTFKSVLQTAAFQRRETYEQLLASVAILEGLGAYGRGGARRRARAVFVSRGRDRREPESARS
jgi:hypothetical protein